MGILGIIYKGLHHVFFGQKLSKTKLSSFACQSIRNLVTNSKLAGLTQKNYCVFLNINPNQYLAINPHHFRVDLVFYRG